MEMPTQWRVSVITLAATIVLLAGCAPLAPASSQKSPSPDSDATSRPSKTPTPVASPSPEMTLLDVSFEDGATLKAGEWDTAWLELLQGDPGFTVKSPDDGNGSFSYTDSATQCQIYFYQGSVTDLDMSQDDRTISDDFLATVLTETVEGATREDVSAHAFDDAVGHFSESDAEWGAVDTRTIWGTSSDGGTWLHSARMFGALGAGVYVGITCPAGQDASVELEKLVNSYLAIVVSPRATG
jgi:hypothetical protein